LEALSILTVLLAGGHLAHLFNAEWLVLVSAIVTAIVSFLQGKPPEPVLSPRKPADQTPPTSSKKG
jgi:hypothetical protein